MKCLSCTAAVPRQKKHAECLALEQYPLKDIMFFHRFFFLSFSSFRSSFSRTHITYYHVIFRSRRWIYSDLSKILLLNHIKSWNQVCWLTNSRCLGKIQLYLCHWCSLIVQKMWSCPYTILCIHNIYSTHCFTTVLCIASCVYKSSVIIKLQLLLT